MFRVWYSVGVLYHTPGGHFVGQNSVATMAENSKNTYVSTLPAPDKLQYIKKVENFSKSNFSKDIDPYESSGWVDNLSLWPPVEFGSIYSYLIDSPGEFTKESLRAYKSLAAYNYYYRSVDKYYDITNV